MTSMWFLLRSKPTRFCLIVFARLTLDLHSQSRPARCPGLLGSITSCCVLVYKRLYEDHTQQEEGMTHAFT